MKRLCPTIHELLAFDAVARYGSLTTAAGVLCISVSGISKQLASLETFIGQPLLYKHGRGVRLTGIGREYWTKISPSLKNIESATVEAMANNTDSGVLTLASAPTFLTKWLIPRLSDFRKQYPGITFSFNQHLGFNDANESDFDAAIRYGTGSWPEVTSDYITGHEFVCIYSAALQKDHSKKIESVKDLLAFTLLHHEEAQGAWKKWARGYNLAEIQILSGPRFVQYSAIIQAVLSGLGVGLVPRILVEEELQSGQINVFGNSIQVEQGHYLCFHPKRLERPVFAHFRDWLLNQGKEAFIERYNTQHLDKRQLHQ